MSETTATDFKAAETIAGQPKIHFNAENVKSTYCNVANAISSREEVILNFGVNKSWDRSAPLFEVDLEHRIVLSPHSAKRLHELIGRLIAEHETRYGPLA